VQSRGGWRREDAPSGCTCFQTATTSANEASRATNDENVCVACRVRISMALGMILAVKRFSIETISVQGILSVVSQPARESECAS